MQAVTTFPMQTQRPEPPGREAALRKQAVELEAFLFAELLRVSNTGSPSPAGGGETQFDSFLRQAQAESVAKSGQTGLAEAIYRSLAGRGQEQERS